MATRKRKLLKAANQRRLTLIEKQYEGGGHTEGEQGELGRLQVLADELPEGGVIDPERLVQLRQKYAEVTETTT